MSVPTDDIVVVGAGRSALIEDLVSSGWSAVTAVDISASALDRLRAFLGERANAVATVHSDVLDYTADRPITVWHDRATFHFLVDPLDQSTYARRAADAVKPGGKLIVAGFAPDGPTRCSGLSVARHDVASIDRVFERWFTTVEWFAHEHTTPSGVAQRFLYVVMQRRTDR